MSLTISEKLCFSPAEAAKAIGIGCSTLFTLLARGELKARKLSTRTLIAASELQRYVESLPASQSTPIKTIGSEAWPDTQTPDRSWRRVEPLS